MMGTPSLVSLTRDLVLVGGGHTHALILRKWAMNPLPGVRVTVINPGPSAPYSGMLPGHVAGHYRRDELDIDLVRLATRAGARLILDAACALDHGAGHVVLNQGPAVGFDVASFDVGITSAMPDLPGFSCHGVPAKPLGPFADAWAAFRAAPGPATVAVLGGGVAGAEIAMAMAHALAKAGRRAEITVIDRGQALGALSPRTAARLRHALARAGVTLVENSTPQEVTVDGVTLADGRLIPAGFVTGAAGALPHPWLAKSPIAGDDGYVPVDAMLRATRASGVFAVGDCAKMVEDPRPKAGVFAVRQAPVLFDNLRATLSGVGPLRAYRPQNDYLKLISLGEKSALAERYGLPMEGALLWSWKDQIDRRFMDAFDDLPTPLAPAPPWPRAAGAGGEPPLCGACGAKVGAHALERALGGFALGPEAGGPGDDAAVITTGAVRQVISTDHLRGFVADYAVVARIAAVHALGDIWAMGAQPQAAVATVILPRQSPALAERALAEITSAARAVMEAAGAQIVGGHTTQGDALTVGFTVTGLCLRAPITVGGAIPGQALILTKPLGTGVILAAAMAARAPGATVAHALREMTRPQGAAAEVLGHATAMTDVTGFGLMGHLAVICRASYVGACIESGLVPMLPGAEALAARGIRSSLYTENRAAVAVQGLADTPCHDLLFDPQTGGGLLAAVPGDGDAECARLRDAGFAAVVIGQTTDTGLIQVV